MPLESVQLLENEEAVQLIITMDIWTEFVALVGVRTAEDECVLVSSLFPACVSDDVFGHHSLTPSTPTTIPTAAPSVPPAFDPQTSSFFNLVPELTELIGDAAPLFDSMLLCPFSRDAHQRLLAAGGQAALLAADAVTAAFTATATATAPSQTGSLAAGLTILHEAVKQEGFSESTALEIRFTRVFFFAARRSDLPARRLAPAHGVRARQLHDALSAAALSRHAHTARGPAGTRRHRLASR